MKDNIQVVRKTIEEMMGNLAGALDKINQLEKELNNLEVMPTGYWEDVNEHTAEKRCSNCKATQTPTIHCKNCGSKNTFKG